MVDDNKKEPETAPSEKPPVTDPQREPGTPGDFSGIPGLQRTRSPEFAEIPAAQEFPEEVSCNQCRRIFPAKSLRAKYNTLLTEAAMICPGCLSKLNKMRLKDWYDHYVQGQEKKFALDPHAFFHVDPPDQIPDGVIAEKESRNQRPPQRGNDRNDRRGGRGQGRNQGRGQGRDGRNQGPNQTQQGRGQGRNQDQQQDPQKPRPLLPQNVKAFRLPKKRRIR